MGRNMNHRRLYRIALFMWATPLVAASVVMLGFLFLRSSFFVVSGMVLLVVGGLCLSAGLIAVMAILATRNQFQESPRRYYKKPALRVLGLLLMNLPIAAISVVISSLLLEKAETHATVSPSGRYLAEVIGLDANEKPPYGQAVTLRPRPGLFQTYARTVVFSSYCLNPVPLWKAEGQLVITCRDARGIETRLTNYRDVKITYALGEIASRNALRASK